MQFSASDTPEQITARLYDTLKGMLDQNASPAARR
jgi:hypothetical protein